MTDYRTDPAFAVEQDEADPLHRLRDEFHIPVDDHGNTARYFCGNSLGLQPRLAAQYVNQELEDWARLAVGGHEKARSPWYRYQEQFRGPMSRVVGAREHEVVLMNSLTVNLHLLFVSFYRPTRERYRILIEEPVFPSDRYAVQTQVRHHGLDPADAVLHLAPREGESTVREEDVEAVLEQDGSSIALVFLSGVNFRTGQRFDLARIARAAHAVGAVAGFDLAHAAGNVPVDLHDSDADFAMWCSYKYLNGGPGAVGGAFVHERHARSVDLPRFGGWWGNDPDTRFQMDRQTEFVPVPSADGWQLSNPPVLAMAPLCASLELFDRAGLDALRAKSLRLTGYLEFLLQHKLGDRVTVTTPADPGRRGCQLSLRLRENADAEQRALAADGFVCDFRPPDTIRVAPTPLYNTFQEVHAFVEHLAASGARS